MRRREFIGLVGGAVVSAPLGVRAQQTSSRPMIGVLSPISSTAAARNIEALRAGLRELGYVEDLTSSARASSEGGMVTPSAFAVCHPYWCPPTIRDAEAIAEAQRPTMHFVRITAEVFRAHYGTGTHPTGCPVARTQTIPRRSTWGRGRG